MYEHNEHDAFRIAGRLEVALGLRLVEELDRQLDRINALVENFRSMSIYAIALPPRRR